MNINKEYIYGIIFFIFCILFIYFFGPIFGQIVMENQSIPSQLPKSYELFPGKNKCPDGYSSITDCNECNQAAIQLGDSDGLQSRCSEKNSNDLYLPGCSQVTSNSGYQFNHNLGSSGTVGYGIVCTKN